MFFKVIILATILQCMRSAEAAIPVAKPEFRMAIEKGYKLEYFFKANWHNAYLFCRYHGLQLATIETKEQQDYVQRLIIANGLSKEYFWTSGQDQDREGKFSWFSTGNNFKYTNWDAKQPDNYKGNENCMHIWANQKWNDVSCSEQYFFICEKPEETVNCNRHCVKSCC